LRILQSTFPKTFYKIEPKVCAENLTPTYLIVDLERWRILRLHFVPVIDPRRRNISVAQPFLDLSDIGVVIERVCGGCGSR
jgi:hypothetical protein